MSQLTRTNTQVRMLGPKYGFAPSILGFCCAILRSCTITVLSNISHYGGTSNKGPSKIGTKLLAPKCSEAPHYYYSPDCWWKRPGAWGCPRAHCTPDSNREPLSPLPVGERCPRQRWSDPHDQDGGWSSWETPQTAHRYPGSPVTLMSLFTRRPMRVLIWRRLEPMATLLLVRWTL